MISHKIAGDVLWPLHDTSHQMKSRKINSEKGSIESKECTNENENSRHFYIESGHE